MKLNSKTFYLFAAKQYDNPSCLTMEEFEADLLLFKYVKRLFTRYQETGEIKERLVLNHLTVLFNLFGPACTSMLFFKISEHQWSILKPFLETLGFLPELVFDVDESGPINTKDIVSDEKIKQLLRQIIKGS